MSSRFGDLTVFHKNYAVAKSCGRQAVRYVKACFALGKRTVLTVKIVFSNRIKRRRRLVKNEYRRIRFIKRPCKQKPLLFAARKRYSALVYLVHHQRIFFIGQALYLIINICKTHTFFEPFTVYFILFAQRYVFCNGSRKNIYSLKNGCKQAVIIIPVKIPAVPAVDKYLTALRQKKTAKQLHKR